jgi:proteasome component ECM29
MTSGGAPLEKVLSVLLPRLLVRVGNNKTLQQEYTSSNNTVLKETLDKIHVKLVEIMSHVISRVRAEESCQLPVQGILQLLYDENTLEIQPVDVFTMNLALTFLNLGVTRCLYEHVDALLPGLLLLLATHSGVASQASASLKSQSHQVAHLLLKVMERMVTEEGVQTNANQTVLEQARRLCSDNEAVASALFDLCMDVVLYQPSSSQTMPPPGLSQAGHE